MERVRSQLKIRLDRMVKLHRYFLSKPVSLTAKNIFPGIIEEGFRINRMVRRVTVPSDAIKQEINSYLLAGEECIFAAGVEVPKEYCDILDVLTVMEKERLLIMFYLNNSF